MSIESIPVKTWENFISGKIDFEYKFLALKVLMARLRLRTNLDTTPEMMTKAVIEIKSFFVKCSNIPSCREDLEKISNFK